MPDNQHAIRSPNNDQANKFKDMARQLEADEDEARFEEAARKVATAPVPLKEAKPTAS